MIGYKKDRAGELVLTRLDEVTLKQASTATEGKYYHASSGEIALDEIYADISQMEKKELEERLMTQYEDRFQYILPLAIIFLAVESLISERRRAGSKEQRNASI
jgi:Ca-activated chloride channel family protein